MKHRALWEIVSRRRLTRDLRQVSISQVKRWRVSVSAERADVNRPRGVGSHGSLGELKEVPR